MDRWGDAMSVIVALDFPEVSLAEKFLNNWPDDVKPFVKVGYHLFFLGGPEWILKLKKQGYRVFLDLKLHDIPTTVAAGALACAKLGVDMTTIHAAGGRRMLEAASNIIAKNNYDTKILAVTHLTSTDAEMLRDDLGVEESLDENIVRYAVGAYKSGCDGIICCGKDIRMIKESTDEGFLAVVPGIRTSDDEVFDQVRVVSPTYARNQGADYLVLGRPLIHAPDPLGKYLSLLA